MKVITTHQNADFDCFASMIAAKRLYPDALLVFSGAQEKNLREFLRTSNLSFQFDKAKNINLKEIEHIVIVDTKLKGRLGPFEKIINDNDNLVIDIYDHHPATPKDIHGDLEIIKERGATTTIMVEILKEKDIAISPVEATIMQLGIYEDTGSLCVSATTPYDLQAASFLLERGADLNTVSDFINKGLNAEQISLLDDLIKSSERYHIGGVDIVIATASTSRYVGDLSVITHKLKDMENLNVVFTMVRMNDRIHVVGRSRLDAVDVGEIAHELNGGGHHTAASAVIKELTLFQAKEKLLNILNEKIHHVVKASEIMISHAKSLSASDSVHVAHEIMSKFNIDTLPVINDDKLVIGIITRHIVEKAIYHSMSEEPVSEFIDTEFSSVFPDAPLHEIERLIIEKKQRLVPIIAKENNNLIGVVCRGDILRVMYGDMLKRPALLHQESSGYRYRYPSYKQIKSLLHDRLPSNVLTLFNTIGRVAEEMTFSAYVVGGFVRDLLLAIENLDIDIVIEGDGIEFARALVKQTGGYTKCHKKFRTAVIILPDGFKIDIATARLEYYEHPAALPIIEFTSIKNDLFRRDFTINALAIKLTGKGDYSLVDFFSGQQDIKDRCIRVLHNLSFVEDPTRVFRAIRFEQRFNFMITKHTDALLRNAVKKDLFSRLSGKRLLMELILMLKEKNPIKSIRRMAEFDVLRFIHPAIIYSNELDSLFKRIMDVISWLQLLYTNIKIEAWFIYLFALIYQLKDEEISTLCQRLAFNERYSKKVMLFIEALNRLRQMSPDRFNVTSNIYMELRGFAPELLLFFMAMTRDERFKKGISIYFSQLVKMKPLLNGDDLKAIGLKAGPIFKVILEEVMELNINGVIKTQEEGIRYVKGKYMKQSGSDSEFIVSV